MYQHRDRWRFSVQSARYHFQGRPRKPAGHREARGDRLACSVVWSVQSLRTDLPKYGWGTNRRTVLQNWYRWCCTGWVPRPCCRSRSSFFAHFPGKWLRNYSNCKKKTFFLYTVKQQQISITNICIFKNVTQIVGKERVKRGVKQQQQKQKLHRRIKKNGMP